MHDHATNPTLADQAHVGDATGSDRDRGLDSPGQPGHPDLAGRGPGSGRAHVAHVAGGRRRLWWVLAAALAPWATAAAIVVGERMA